MANYCTCLFCNFVDNLIREFKLIFCSISNLLIIKSRSRGNKINILNLKIDENGDLVVIKKEDRDNETAKTAVTLMGSLLGEWLI